MYKGIIIEGIYKNYKRNGISLEVEANRKYNNSYYYNDSFTKLEYKELLTKYIEEIQPNHNKFKYIYLTFYDKGKIFYKGRYNINSFKRLSIEVMARIFELYEDKKEM